MFILFQFQELGIGDLLGQRQLYVEGGRLESCAIYDHIYLISPFLAFSDPLPIHAVNEK